MIIDRAQVRHTFQKYVEKYNAEDPKIRLKIIHTYHVAEDADEIAESLGLTREERDLAWLLGMLHDIGRFEQIRRYHTFTDAQSIPHAHLSCEVLFPDLYQVDQKFFSEMPNGTSGTIENYAEQVTEEDRDLIRTAIWEHSSFQLPEGLDDRHRMYCNILRDADKIDIFRVNVETPLSDIIGCTAEELNHSMVSPYVLEAVKNHTTVQRRKDFNPTPADHLISHCCLAFELVYPKSREITKRQGYLDQILAFRNQVPKTNDAMVFLTQEIKRLASEPAF